jgi:hypothetical protein
VAAAPLGACSAGGSGFGGGNGGFGSDGGGFDGESSGDGGVAAAAATAANGNGGSGGFGARCRWLNVAAAAGGPSAAATPGMGGAIFNRWHIFLIGDADDEQRDRRQQLRR